MRQASLLLPAAFLLFACAAPDRSDGEGETSEGEGEGGEGEGEGGEGEGGEGEGEGGEGEGEGEGEEELEPCPLLMPDPATYRLRSPDFVDIWFDFLRAPQEGPRPVILLLHKGINGSRRDWEDKSPGLLESLRCAGYTLINADLRGHLQSNLRVFEGYPGEPCEEGAERCLSGVCDEAVCGDFLECDPGEEETGCPEELDCHFSGVCFHSVERREEFVIPQSFEPEEWAPISDDIGAVFDLVERLATREFEIIRGSEGRKGGGFDDSFIDESVPTHTTLRDLAILPEDDRLAIADAVFLELQVGDELRRYSVWKVNPNGTMWLRSSESHAADFDFDGNEDGFYTTTPLTEPIDEAAWILKRRTPFPFDPTRLGVIGALVGANGALRYAGFEDSRVKATVLLTPLLRGSDGIRLENIVQMTNAVSDSKVLAFAADRDGRGVQVLAAMDSTESEAIETRKVRDSTAQGTDLAGRPGVINQIRRWLQEQF